MATDFSTVAGVVKKLDGTVVENESATESSYTVDTTPEKIELQPATALEFRQKLNQNFTNIEESFEEVNKEIENVYDNMVGVVVSIDEPTKGIQKAGDFWFKVIE